MTNNPLPLLTPIEGYDAFPPHALIGFDKERTCIYCEEKPFENWSTFEEYAAWWLENEYEGEPGHYLDMTEERWNYLHATCLA